MAYQNPAEQVGAMPADNETDLVRCEGCHEWAEEAELDDAGLCACCQPGEMTTAQELGQ